VAAVSAAKMIFERMTDIEKCFAGNRDDGNLIER
jgi:hypothetical protein